MPVLCFLSDEIYPLDKVLPLWLLGLVFYLERPLSFQNYKYIHHHPFFPENSFGFIVCVRDQGFAGLQATQLSMTPLAI